MTEKGLEYQRERRGKGRRIKEEKYVALQQFFSIMISVSSIPSSLEMDLKSALNSAGFFFFARLGL